MPLKDLSEEDREIVRQCVAAITEGGFIDEPEFFTRLGVSRQEVLRLLSVWPDIDDTDGSDGYVAVNNCMNEVCHSLPIASRDWDRWFTVPPTEVEAVFHRWKA